VQFCRVRGRYIVCNRIEGTPWKGYRRSHAAGLKVNLVDFAFAKIRKQAKSSTNSLPFNHVISRPKIINSEGEAKYDMS
jgi:hypothetical protein